MDRHSDSDAAATLGAMAYQTLLSRIRTGRVPPQTKLIDTALAAELNVSRMPVREALLRLVHEGYLVGTTRGFMLPQLTPRDIADIFEVRSLIEPHAAAAAVYAMDEFALATLEAAYRNAAEAVEQGAPVALMEANTWFRRTRLAAVPNQRLAGTISRFVRRRDALHAQDSMARFVAAAEDRLFTLSAEAKAKDTVNMIKSGIVDSDADDLRAKLEGEGLTMAWFAMGSVPLLEIGVRQGFDLGVIDLQHGLWDLVSTHLAVSATGVMPVMMRAAANSVAAIGEALDSGARGVLIPLIETAKAGEAAVAAVPGIDFVFIGTGDLTLSIGCFPEIDERHEQACLSVYTACRDAGVPCGIFTSSAKAARSRLDEGYAAVVAANDIDVTISGFATAARELSPKAVEAAR